MVIPGARTTTTVQSNASNAAICLETDSSGACMSQTAVGAPGTISPSVDGSSAIFAATTTADDRQLSSLLSIVPVPEPTTTTSYVSITKSVRVEVTATNAVGVTETSSSTSIYPWATGVQDRALAVSTSEAAGSGKEGTSVAIILCWVALFILYDER
jgi:hypothetical protein